MTVWPDVHDYITDQPGIGLDAAKWLLEETGAMAIGSDSLSLEVVPNPDPEKFLPVHSYMFATAGAPIIEVLRPARGVRREAVRVRLPRLPAQAPRRDRQPAPADRRSPRS